VVVVVLAAIALIWFQPQKLLYDQHVDEGLPTAVSPTADAGDDGAEGLDSGAEPAPAEPVQLAAGAFISREHRTTGTARLLQLSDGQVILRFEGFETSNGPVLVVWLSRNQAAGQDEAFDDDYVALGFLKGNVGDQNYVVPPEVDPTGWTSVVVWCDRFDVSFGAADLAYSAES
jgi:hypothetical protein